MSRMTHTPTPTMQVRGTILTYVGEDKVSEIKGDRVVKNTIVARQLAMAKAV